MRFISLAKTKTKKLQKRREKIAEKFSLGEDMPSLHCDLRSRFFPFVLSLFRSFFCLCGNSWTSKHEIIWEMWIYIIFVCVKNYAQKNYGRYENLLLHLDFFFCVRLLCSNMCGVKHKRFYGYLFVIRKFMQEISIFFFSNFIFSRISSVVSTWPFIKLPSLFLFESIQFTSHLATATINLRRAEHLT